MLELLKWPMLACIVLASIHTYLGMHVIRRGIIFVDLALAQTAAMGTLVGFASGIAMHTTGSYLISLAFALAGALFFTWARTMEKVVLQEAVIGITYVFAAAAAVLILSKSAAESEHIKDMLVGNILFVKPGDILKTAIAYAAIGAFHFVFRKKFWLITEESTEACRKDNINVGLWDFFFYATFGAVVTLSVEMAGVLMVFSFLIIPAICAAMITKAVKSRLFISWGLAILCSIGGIAVSVSMDTPTGASIVAVFGIMFALFLAVKSILMRFEKNTV